MEFNVILRFLDIELMTADIPVFSKHRYIHIFSVFTDKKESIMNTEGEGTSQFSSCLQKGSDLYFKKFVKTCKTVFHNFEYRK